MKKKYTKPQVKKNQPLVNITFATATATPAAAIFTATATAATRTLFAGSGDVHREGPAVDGLAVQGLDGFLRLFRRAHGDERKPARTTCGPVHHQIGFDYRAVRREGVVQVVFRSVVGQVAYKQFRVHS